MKPLLSIEEADRYHRQMQREDGLVSDAVWRLTPQHVWSPDPNRISKCPRCQAYRSPQEKDGAFRYSMHETPSDLWELDLEPLCE